MTDGYYHRAPLAVRAWEGGMWFFLFAPLAWGMWMFGGTRTWGYATGLVLSYAGLAMVALRNTVAGEGKRWRVAGIFWWVAAMTGWVVARDTWAEAKYPAMWDALKWMALAGSLWAWMQASRGGERWKGILGAVLLLLASEALYGAWQGMTGARSVLWGVRPEQYGARLSGSYFCPNHFANMLAMGIPMAAALACLRGAGMPIRLLSGYYLALSLPVLYGTMSRSAWLGTAGGLGTALLCWLWRKNRLWFLAGLAAVPLGLAAAGWVAWETLPLVRERMSPVLHGDGGDFGGGGRLAMWSDSLAMWKARAAAGYGGGSFVWAFPPHQRTAKKILRYDYPHNEYVQVLAEYGWIGGGLLAAGLAGTVVLFLRGTRKTGSTVAAGLLCGAAGSVAAGAVHAVFDFNFHIFANPCLLALLVGTAWGVWLDPPKEDWQGGGYGDEEAVLCGWSGKAAGTGLALAFLALGTLAARGGLSYWSWLKGEMEMGRFEWEAAERQFRKSVARCGWNDQPMTSMGNLRTTQAAWYRDSDGEAEREGKAALAREAEDWFRKALENNPFNVDAMYGTGRAKQAAGDEEGALAWMKTATDAAPTYRFYQNQYALALRRAGRLAEAKAFLEEREAFAGLGDRGRTIMGKVKKESRKSAE